MHTLTAKLSFLLLILISCSKQDVDSFLPLNESWIVDKEEAISWSMVKNNNLPTLPALRSGLTI